MGLITSTKAVVRSRFPGLTQAYRSAYCFVRDLRLRFLSPEGVFNHIYENNQRIWNSDESASGPGSAMSETAPIREALPGIIADFGVRSLLDLP